MKWLNQECQVHRFWGTGILKYIDFKEPGFSSTSILGNQDSQVHRFWGTRILKYIDFGEPGFSSTSILGNRECQVHRFWGTGILKYIDFKEPGFSSTSILRNRGSQVHRFWGTQTSRPNKKLCQKPKVNPFNKWYCWNISPKKTQLPNCLNCGFGWVRYYFMRGLNEFLLQDVYLALFVLGAILIFSSCTQSPRFCPCWKIAAHLAVGQRIINGIL